MTTERKIIVTGGAGFIGSAVVRHLIDKAGWQVVNLDKLTYAANLESLGAAANSSRYRLAKADILDRQRVRALLHEEKPDAVMHLAAESHVDRSIDGPAAFVETNIVGTYSLLEEVLTYWRGQSGERKAAFRFQHVSTDEVYGSLGEAGLFQEDSPYRPNSPYSASKAASDHLARAWFHTFGLPVVITNCSNNYGPCQFPEKLIPLTIVRALQGNTLPVYGNGQNVRDWLHVDDHAQALVAVMQKGRTGETYNIGGGAEKKNIEVVEAVCSLLDQLSPMAQGGSYKDLIRFVQDRPGHDLRYAIDSTKVRNELQWQPSRTFDSGLAETVRWYLNNRTWWSRIISGEYRTERKGLSVDS